MNTEDENRQEVYYIPTNYEDAGGILGGHFTQRNGIEMALFAGPVALLNVKFIFPYLPLEPSIIICMCTTFPVLALCAFGISGESITQILMAYIRYRRKRRKLSYLSFDFELENDSSSHFSLDKFLDDVSYYGIKGTLAKMEANKKKASAEDETSDAPQAKATSSRKKNGERKNNGSAAKSAPMKAGKADNKMMNSAVKEMLLRKLELSNDDEEY